MRKTRVGSDDRIAQGLNNLRFDMIGQMPPGLRRRHLAPAILDFFFLGQRVVNAREELDIVLKNGGERMCGGFTLAAVLFGQQVQRGFEVQLLPVDGELQPGHSFIKQPIPRGGPDRGLVMQKFLQLIGQLMRLHRAHPIKDGFIAGKFCVGGQQAGKMVIIQPIEFQPVENQRCGIGRDPVLTIRHELGAVAVGGALVIAQTRKRHDAPGDDVDLLIALDSRQQARRVQIGKLAFECFRKIGTFLREPFHVAGNFRAIGCRIKVAEVPFGQVSQILSSAWVGIKNGLSGLHQNTFHEQLRAT